MLTIITGLLLATGCSNSLKGDDVKDGTVPTSATPTPGVVVPPLIDQDGDGWGEDEDCNDRDPTINPGQTEQCDGLDNDCDGQVGADEVDANGNGILDCAEQCFPPTGALIPTLQACDYQPTQAGQPFAARIEWSMSHAMTDPTSGAAVPAHTFNTFPTYRDAMHAPAVFQATDDNLDGQSTSEDIPDIAVIMGEGDSVADGVLRLISGDGSRVHDSVHWLAHTNANGADEYAPYHYAGVAMGNIDGDTEIEIATLVTRQSDGLCFPAVYEVHGAGQVIWLELDRVYGGGNHLCTGAAPSMGDIDADGDVELIYGRSVLSSDLTFEWLGNGGRGWYHQIVYADGYWNSGTFSFPYDMDGDGQTMEVVAGSHVYTSDGGTYCELGEYIGFTWEPALDGYPAVADVLRFPGDVPGEPEIVITGNEFVSVYRGSPDFLGRCELVDQIPNAPEDNPAISSGLPVNPNCQDRPARGGPATIADFDGDGDNEVAVAGSCWYTVYTFQNNQLQHYALAQTLDYSSASTGGTVFDFNGDGLGEVVFSDEDALYVWGVDTTPGLQPWERLFPYLIDVNHKSWTIHEYPMVVDVDKDGKAEIVSVNASNPTYSEKYGIYVLGSADDSWVSARQSWNQHAYHITNLDSNDQVGYSPPNYAPYTSGNFNSFRQQAPGTFGITAAPNLFGTSLTCQEACGDVVIWIQVSNEGAYISADPGVVIGLYGVVGNQRTLIDSEPLGAYLHPGVTSDAYEFRVGGWGGFDHLVAVVDDPAFGPLGANGQAEECDEADNEVFISLQGVCP